MPFPTLRQRDASGGCCQRTFRLSQPYNITFTGCAIAGCWMSSTKHWSVRADWLWDETLNQVPRSSTVNRLKQPKVAGYQALMPPLVICLQMPVGQWTKKVKGRKRHIMTDTQGKLLYGTVHSADIQDRDGAVEVVGFTCQAWPTINHLFADGGYVGWKLQLALLQTMEEPPAIEIVRRPNNAAGFVLIARRWVVERTFAWLGRCCRLAKDWEKTLSSSNAWLTIAAIRRQSRFIAKRIKSNT